MLNDLIKARAAFSPETSFARSHVQTTLSESAIPSLLQTRMRPLFFNDGPQRLFGAFYRPSTEHYAGAPVLICPPVGHEYVRSYNAIRKLCGRLSESGFAVLKFDYCGLGDSYGDGSEAHLGEWRENIRAAASELCRQSGQTELTVVGFRFGATLVAGLRLQEATVRSLVLWDPVVDGAGYLAELRQLHADCLVDTLRFRKPQPHRASDGELLGFRWPARLQESIAPLSLLNRPFPYDNCYLITSSAGPEYDRLAHSLTRNTRGRFTHELVPEPAGWDDYRQVESALSAHRLVAAISAKIANGFV